MKAKKKGSLSFFVIFALIIALTYGAFFGIDNYYGDTRNVYIKGASDIRWGIDIQGGVEAVFSPDLDGDKDSSDKKETIKVTKNDMKAAKTVIETRLVNANITDYEVYTDDINHQIIVRFPWAAGEEEFDAYATVDKLGASAQLYFYEGTFPQGADGSHTISEGMEPFMLGDVVKNSEVQYGQISEGGINQYLVSLDLDAKGQAAFAKASASAATNGTQIGIFMDGKEVSVASCNEPLDGKNVVITGAESAGGFTVEQATELSDQINAGSLPFALTNEGKVQIISPTLGSNALNVMVIAGAIAFVLVCLLMITRYRLNGLVASIALLGQLAGTVACISGFFPGTESFTLTIPGIAGIILSIGVGVDCNVISAERIRDEFKNGKTIDGSIDSGFRNSRNAIIDGNVTIVIVSVVLMGAFGSPDSLLTKIFSPIMSLFGTSITGSIYSFGYTLLIGVIFNLIMGVFASKYMLKGISKIKCLRKPALYGGKNNG